MITKKTITRLTDIVNETPNHLLKDIKKQAKKEHLEDVLAYLLEEEYYEKKKGGNGYYIWVYWSHNPYDEFTTIETLCHKLGDNHGICYIEDEDRYVNQILGD